MDSCRLVVWISIGILGFQGATLAFDLLICTALSWLYVRMHGLPAVERRVEDPTARAGVVAPEHPRNPPAAEPQTTTSRSSASVRSGGLMQL